MYHKGNVHYDSWALEERRNKINSFLSHLNTKLQRQPVFCPKLHRLSGSPPQMDLLQIWVQGVEPMARQTIKKPITSQGGPRRSRPIFSLNCKIRQTGALIVGELLLAVAVLQCSGQFTRLAGSKPVECIRGQGPDTTLTCWCWWRDTISRQHYGHYNLARPRNVSAKLSPTLSTDRPLTPRRLPCRSSFSKLSTSL